MPYIGRELERGTYLKLDDISSSFDGNKTIFNLTKGGDPFFPGSPQSIIVSVNGTILEPVTEYGIDSSKIVFATAPANGHAFFSITLGLPFGVFDNGSIEDGSLAGFKLSNPFNYDNGLLFLNSLTDKVGIRTENPTHDLDVHGDVRIVGILTVGTSSLILDGSNNKIQVGTALTLSHNDGAQIGKSHLHSTGYDLKTGAKIKLGDNGNLELFYSADGSFISHTASSAKLFINTSSSAGIEINKGLTENMAKFIPDGAVELYHGMGGGAGAQKKFNTSTTGATVTGKLVVTGDLDVQGTTTTLDTTLTEVDKLEVGANNTTVGVAITQSGTGDALTIDDGTSRVFTVQDGGSVRIGDNASYSTASSAGNLVIGSTSGGNGISILSGNTGNTTGTIAFGDSGSGNAGAIFYRHNDNTMLFRVAGGTRMSIKGGAGGKVGIGTTSAKTQLHAYNGTPSDTGGILVSNVNYASNQDKPYLIIGTKDWTGAATNWNTFGFQHKIKVDSDGIPRLTIDGASAGSEVEHFTLKDGGSLGLGVTNPQGRLHIPDSRTIRFGNDSDARLSHTGSHFLLNNYTGNTYLRINGTEEGIVIKANDSVQLFHDNNLRFNTTADGIKVIGPNSGTGVGIGTTAGHDPLILASFNNGVSNSSQFRILSKRDTDGIDWSSSYTRIQQRIDVTDQAYIQFNGSDNTYGMEFGTLGDEKFAKFIRNGAVELYHDNGQRFNTTPQGINVTTVGDVPQVAIAQTTATAYSVNGTVSFVNANNTTAQIQGRTGSASTTGDIIFLCNTVGDESLAVLEDGKVRVPDRGSFVVGQGNDLTLKHDTNSTITNITGQLAIENTAGNLSIKASNSTGDIIMRAGGGSSSENAIVAVHHGEVVLSFNGATRLTTTNTGVDITDNLKVAGITTFSGDINVDGEFSSGKTLVLNSNASDPVIKIQGSGPNFIRFASDASGTVDSDSIDLVYRTTPNQLVFERASDAVDLFSVDADNGLVAITNNLNVTGALDVDGATTLDGLTVSEASTFSADVTVEEGDVNVGDGTSDARILIKKADNNTADHIQFYNGTTKTGEIGSLDNTWLRINQGVAKNIYTPRYIRADGGFFVDDTTKGINGSGNFIGGTIAGASDYDTLLRSDTNDTMHGYLNVGGNSVSGNEGGQINLTQAPNSTLDGTTVAIDQYINKIRFFEQGGNDRGAGIDFTRITGNPTDNEIFSSGLTGVGYTVTHLRSFGIPNGVVAISTSNASHIPLTVTNSGGAGNNTVITKFVGNSDGLEVRNINSGDYHIRVNSLNTGISFYNGGNGMQFFYDGSRKFSVVTSGLSLNDELTFEKDDEGVTTYAGGRFYKKNGGGIAIRQSSGNQTPIIEANNGTLQGTILHTGNIDDLDLPSGITITGASPQLNFKDSTTNADDFFIHINNNKFYVLTDLDDDGDFGDDTTHHYPLVLDNGTKKIASYGTPVLNGHQGFNPYDVVHGYNNSNPDSIRFNFTEMAMELSPPYGGTDTTQGLIFPAFRVNTNTGEKFKLSVQIRSAASTTNGIYIRLYEYDAELPDGKTHISHDASSNAVVQEDTRKANISPAFENQAGDTDWRTKTFTYTPTSTAVWASLIVLNWSGHGTNSLYVRDYKRELDLSSVGVSTANQIVLGNDSTGSTARRIIFSSADTGTVTIQADTDGGATYTPSTGTITANNFSGSGSAITNVNAAKVVVSDESSDTTCHPLFATTNTGNAAVKVGSNLSFNSSTGKLTATSFSGTHTGARTGNHATDTGNRSTTGYVEAGRGSGSVAITTNDGYGNANLCFNHKNGVPDNTDATASSGRIECSVDSATANMYFELHDSVTEGTATGNAGTAGGGGQNGIQMHLTTSGVTINPFLSLKNELRFKGTNAELEFNTGGPRLRLSASNQLSFHSGGGLNSGDDERMRIASDGLVTMYNDLIVQAPSTTNQTRLHGGSIELNRSADDAFIDFKTSTSEDFDCRIQKSANQLNFHTGGNGSTVHTLALHANGNVSIPNGKLFVAEEVFFRNEFNLQGATTEATKHMDIGFEGHGFSMRRTTYNDQNHDIFLSVGSSGVVTLQSNIGSTSDAKLKKNITTISDGAIENIKKLRPVKFDWIADDKMNDNNGFIAQELKEVFPNLVYGTEYDPTLIDEEKGTKGGIKSEGYSIDLVGISANVTKALQEAIAKIETLEAEVAALKAKVG